MTGCVGESFAPDLRMVNLHPRVLARACSKECVDSHYHYAHVMLRATRTRVAVERRKRLHIGYDGLCSDAGMDVWYIQCPLLPRNKPNTSRAETCVKSLLASKTDSKQGRDPYDEYRSETCPPASLPCKTPLLPPSVYRPLSSLSLFSLSLSRNNSYSAAVGLPGKKARRFKTKQAREPLGKQATQRRILFPCQMPPPGMSDFIRVVHGCVSPTSYNSIKQETGIE